jgi:hypothetical protein
VKKRIICCFFLVSVVSFLFAVTSYAEETPGLPYNATPIIPDNQLNKSVSYFDLLVQPDQTQLLKIEVANSSNKEIKVSVKPHTARTTRNGTVDYSGMDLKSTSNLPFSFEEVTSKEKIVTIAPRSKEIVEFSVKIPAKKFRGVVLGGFYIHEIKPKAATTENKGIQIRNEFSLVIGCQLRMSEISTNKNFSLNDVYIDNYGGYFSVISSIHNVSAELVSFYSLKGEITDKNNKSVLKFSKDSFSMAPNSICDLPEKVDTKKLPSGTYQMQMTILSRDKSKSWKLTKNFEVKSSERKGVLSKSLDKDNVEKNSFLYIVIAVLSIIIILFIGVLLYRKYAKSH